MIITKHGIMRFKQRQKIKNNREMQRKTIFAIERGKLLKDYSNSPDINCYSFDGFYYLIADNDRLVTVLRHKKQNKKRKKAILESIRLKELIHEYRYSCSASAQVY